MTNGSVRHWVLLRGLIRESRYWEDFPARLSAAFPSDSISTPDLPGHGVRHGEPSPLSVSAMVACYRADMARCGVSPPYVLLGLSLGGMVATEWARQYPDEVCGVVLINTSARPFGRPWHRLKLTHWPGIIKLLTVGASDAAFERAILRMTSAFHVADEALLRRWVARRQERPVSRVNLLRQLLAAARYRAPRRFVGPPALLLGSTRDAMVAIRCSRTMARTWECPLFEHPRAGHDLPLDDPDWVVARLGAWLGSGG